MEKVGLKPWSCLDCWATSSEVPALSGPEQAPSFLWGFSWCPYGPTAGDLRDRAHSFVSMEAPGKARRAVAREAECIEARNEPV